MNIVWFSWKDINHPLAGGAEVVSSELRKNLVADGHSVTLLTARYSKSTKYETTQGIKVVRLGNKITTYLLCSTYYILKLRKGSDYIIDEMNTLPFWAGLFTRKKKVLLAYQLAREVWFYQLPKPLSYIGYYIEPIYLKILSKIYKQAITESASAANELKKYGFSNVGVFRVGMHTTPIDKFQSLKPSKNPNILFFGSFRPMKRPDNAFIAFEKAKKIIPGLRMTMAGSTEGGYASELIARIDKSIYKNDINILGKVSAKKKEIIMRHSTVSIVTSVKEGWGLIVTEAGAMGCPAIAYDVDGLRDSVVEGKTGVLVENGNTDKLADAIVSICKDNNLRNFLALGAWEYSHNFNFKNCYSDFIKILNIESPLIENRI